MKELLKDAKDFKIIPNNFKSSGALNIIEINSEEIKAELILIDEAELIDYPIGSNVEIFGVNPLGLVYFETKILARENNIISFAISPDYSIIQRREYSGLTDFKNMAKTETIIPRIRTFNNSIQSHI